VPGRARGGSAAGPPQPRAGGADERARPRGGELELACDRGRAIRLGFPAAGGAVEDREPRGSLALDHPRSLEGQCSIQLSYGRVPGLSLLIERPATFELLVPDHVPAGSRHAALFDPDLTDGGRMRR